MQVLLNHAHLLLRWVVGIMEASLDITEHEIASLNPEQLNTAECPLHCFHYSFDMIVIKAFGGYFFYDVQTL